MKALDFRILWTWDCRMHWALPCGGDIVFSRRGYLDNYKRLIDFMAEHGLEYLIIWGFLRQSHGGEKAAHEICAYGRKRGVGILAGVGINSYGGFVYGGPHRYNLDTFLAKHPRLRAVGPDGQPVFWRWPLGIDFSRHTNACPSAPEVRRWHVAGLEWMLRTFDLGGIQFETGDIGSLCCCPRCLRRSRDRIKAGQGTATGSRRRDERVSFEDMVDCLPPLLDQAHRLRPDLFLVYTVYKAWSPALRGPAQLLADKMPPYAVCQWGYEGQVENMLWIEENGRCRINDRPPSQLEIFRQQLKPPTPRNSFDLAYGGHHPQFGLRGVPQHAQIRAVCQAAARIGLNGLKLYGETSDNFDGTGTRRFNEVNYLAFSEFSRNPTMPLEEFEAKYAARMVPSP